MRGVRSEWEKRRWQSIRSILFIDRNMYLILMIPIKYIKHELYYERTRVYLIRGFPNSNRYIAQEEKAKWVTVWRGEDSFKNYCEMN